MATFPTKNLSKRYVCMAFGLLKSTLARLCTSTKINPYSKYKPVVSSANTMTDALFAEVNWGYAIPKATAAAVDFYNKVLGNGSWSYDSSTEGGRLLNQGWYYVPPYGGEVSKFRLGDFRGYSPDATQIGSVSCGNVSNATTTIVAFADFGEFSFHRDFENFKNGYIGFMFRRQDGGAIYYKSNNVIGATDIALTQSETTALKNLGGGNYHCIAFVTMMGGVSSFDGVSRITDFRPFPGCLTSFKYDSTGGTVGDEQIFRSIFINISPSRNLIECYVEFTNITKNFMTFNSSTLRWQIVATSIDGITNTYTGICTVSGNNETVQPNAKISRSVNIPHAIYKDFSEYTGYITLLYPNSGGTYKAINGDSGEFSYPS